MTTIAELMVEVGANISGFTSGMNSVDNRIGSIGDRLNQLGGSLQSAGLQLTAMAAPIAAIGAAGVHVASGFQDVVNQLQTFGGLAGDELESVRQLALQLGADTMFSASDAANAMLELVKAGQSVEQAMSSANGVLEMAAVGGMGMAEAAGIMSSALAIFGLEAEDAAMVSDTLARGASASRADVRSLGQALSNVGGVARLFGMNINQTTAALSVFENAGIQGAEAGTQLRSMLLNLMRTTPDVTQAWDDLGVSIYDMQGNMRDFDAIIDDLGAALGGLTDQEANEYLVSLGGSYGIVGLQALIAAGGIDTMQAAMEGSPSAASLAAGAMNTFSGRIEALKGSVETLLITAMTPFMENVLTPMVDRINDVVDAMGNWVQANPELMGQILMMAGGFTLLGPAITIAGTALKVLAVPLGLVSTLFGILVSPVGLVVAGFTAIMALGGELEGWFSNLKGVLGPAAETGLFGLQTAFAQITSGQTELGLMTLGVSLGVIVDAAKQAAALTLDHFVTALENITGLDVSGGLVQLGAFLEQAAAWAGKNVLQPIVDGFTGLASGVQGFFDTLGKDVNPAAIQAILDTVVQVGAALGTLVAGLAQVGGEAIGATLKTIGDALPGLANGLADIINTVGGLLDGSVGPAQALSSMGAAIGTLATNLLSIPVGAVDGLIEAINATLGIDLPSLEEIWTGIQNAVQSVREAVEGFFDILEGAWVILQPFLQPIVDWFNDTFAAIGEEGGAVDIVTQAFNAIKTLIEGIWAAVSPGLTALTDGIQTLLEPVAELIGTIVAGLESLRGLSGVMGEAQSAVAASGIGREELWQMALREAGGNDLVARIVFGQLEGSLAGRAMGGPVSANTPYLVGERGPELFVPSLGGRIVPNGALGGGVAVTVNVTAYGTNEREFADLVLRALRDRGL